MEKISGTVKATAEHADEAARKQASGVQQVGQAAQELDGTAQQNAALVKQTAASAGAQKQRAVQLSDRVARFKLPEPA